MSVSMETISRFAEMREDFIKAGGVKIDAEMKSFISGVFSIKVEGYEDLLKLEEVCRTKGELIFPRSKEKLCVISAQLDYLARYNGARLKAERALLLSA